MINKLLSYALATTLAISPVASQAQDTRTTVSGVLCEVPQSCDTNGDLHIQILPEIEGGLRQVGQESSLNISFSCSREEGSLKQAFFVNIPNRVPAFLHGPFEQGQAIPYQVVHHNREYQDTMSCSIPYNQIPVQ